MSFHLPDQQGVLFSETDQIESVLECPTIKHTKFLAWMEANKKYPEARELTYPQFPTKFVFRDRAWYPRTTKFAIGRLYNVKPGSGELYYLRCLLNIVKGPMSFEDIMCINGVQYYTFRDAIYSLGLLDDDKEYIDGIKEANLWSSATSLRSLFVNLLVSASICRPEVVWEETWIYLSDDFEYRQRALIGRKGLELTEEQRKYYALLEIDKLLKNAGRCLADFPTIIIPTVEQFSVTGNGFILDEMRYDPLDLRPTHDDFLMKCTDEQRVVYDRILHSVDTDGGGFFFVYGYGGTGRTFLWNGLSACLRLRRKIVVNIASSGIASLLLPGGRTAHSRFKIPIDVVEDSLCNIEQKSDLAELLVHAELIIWDEAPLMHKHCFECLDRTLRDLMRLENSSALDSPFGGKTVVLGGDFRQILPVIPRGSRQDIVHAAINSSYLWDHCVVLKLTKNMRLQSDGVGIDVPRLVSFSNLLESIGDGTFGDVDDCNFDVRLPAHLLLKYSGDPVEAIVRHVYMDDGKFVDGYLCFKDRAILAPTLQVVEAINDFIVPLRPGVACMYLSADSCSSNTASDPLDDDLNTLEFLNGIKCSGVPNHQLLLKVGTPVMLLRNIDPINGLCNGTRLILTKLGKHVLEAEVIIGQGMGSKVLIPRMTLTPSDPKLPLKFQRRQFPLIISYAMSINKSQGQSLKYVGLFLKNPVFTHGQLYVAMSRVTDESGLRILICKDGNKDDNLTQNVVYREVYQNL